MFTSEICNKALANKDNLKRHKEIHFEGNTGENLLKDLEIYYCDMCEYSTSRTENLTRHKKTKTHLTKLEKKKGEIKFSCDICEFSTFYAFNLKKHQNIHTNEPVDKIYSCDKCEKTFDRRDNLKRHVKQRKEKPQNYSCDICEKTFSQKFNLKVHRQIHTGENLLKNSNQKQISCEVCTYSTYSLSNLKRHEKVHIKKEPSNEKYPCDLCNKAFTWRDNLTSHK